MKPIICVSAISFRHSGARAQHANPGSSYPYGIAAISGSRPAAEPRNDGAYHSNFGNDRLGLVGAAVMRPSIVRRSGATDWLGTPGDAIWLGIAGSINRSSGRPPYWPPARGEPGCRSGDQSLTPSATTFNIVKCGSKTMRSLILETTDATRATRRIAKAALDCPGVLRRSTGSRRSWLAAAAVAGLMASPAVAAENTLVKSSRAAPAAIRSA